MEKITGRSDDMIILRGVNVFPTQLEEIVLRTAGLAPHFQLVLTRQGRLDALTVRVEARTDCSPQRRDAAARDLTREVKDRVGISVEVEVIDPRDPRALGGQASAGRRPPVVDCGSPQIEPASTAGSGRYLRVDRFLLYRTYDELEVGQTQRTRGRTITETDIVNWCSLTGDWFYPHIDRVAAERSMFGQRVAPGIMVFALGTGLGVPADATTILANYGTDRLRYTAPDLDQRHHLSRHRGRREIRQGREGGTGVVPLGHPQPERRHRLRESAEDPHRKGACPLCRRLRAAAPSC